MAVKFLNRVKVNVATTGTGTVTLGSAVSTFFTVAGAGGADQDVYYYELEDASDFEIGLTTYTASGTTATRTLIKSSTGSKLNLSGSAVWSIQCPAENITQSSVIYPPQGRLTLTTVTPVMTADATAQTTVYYTPYQGNSAPVYDATSGLLVNRAFSELSQATTDATKSPAAVGTYKNYDVFRWDDAGTDRATRGPAWTKARTFTVTIASPGVVSATGHGLKEGFPFVPTTDGALPTNMTAGTTYFVSKTGFTADAFQFSATEGGASVNTTGTQSGTHTATDSNVVRGTGAGTTELELINGYYRNKVAITNGPGAGLGIYLGTIRSNGSSQIEVVFGGTGAAGGDGARCGVWNAYNRRPMKFTNIDTTDSWAYTLATFQLRDAGATGNGFNNAVKYICGLSEDVMTASAVQAATANSSANIGRWISVGLNKSTLAAPDASSMAMFAGTNLFMGGSASFMGTMPLGYGWVGPIEESTATGACTWYGDAGGAANDTYKTAFHVTIWA